MEGITSSSDSALSPGYSKLHGELLGEHLDLIGFVPAFAFFERTTALMTPIAITRIAGTTVHAISSPVFPWIGGPSVSSSGGTRKAQPPR